MSEEQDTNGVNKYAVYGSLRAGLHNHALIKDCTLLSTETLQGFEMFSLGGFPCVYKNPVDDVLIEVYEVDSESTRQALDRLEGHPDWYKREVVETSQGPAWLYVMQRAYPDAPYVEGGDWVQYKQFLNTAL